MKQNSQIWQSWAKTLNDRGLKDITAAILEALGPLSVLGAQLLYIGEPFLGSLLPEGYLNELTDLLENPQETQAFIDVLRQSDRPTGA